MVENMHLLVILPTYNEAINIEDMITQIDQTIGKEVLYNILVVDDSSPDGTGDIVQQLSTDYPVLLQRRAGKLGLGTAYTCGFDYAIEHKYTHAITMDSDFSHNPKYLKKMVQLGDYDLVLGSRYTKGGAVKNWPFHRNLLSRGANLLVSLFITRNIADNTSGFRMYKTDLLQKVPYHLNNNGYSYLFEYLKNCQKAGANIKEMPFTFIERVAGKSKVSQKEIYKAIYTLWRVFWKK